LTVPYTCTCLLKLYYSYFLRLFMIYFLVVQDSKLEYLFKYTCTQIWPMGSVKENLHKCDFWISSLSKIISSCLSNPVKGDLCFQRCVCFQGFVYLCLNIVSDLIVGILFDHLSTFSGLIYSVNSIEPSSNVLQYSVTSRG